MQHDHRSPRVVGGKTADPSQAGASIDESGPNQSRAEGPILRSPRRSLGRPKVMRIEVRELDVHREVGFHRSSGGRRKLPFRMRAQDGLAPEHQQIGHTDDLRRGAHHVFEIRSLHVRPHIAPKASAASSAAWRSSWVSKPANGDS